MQRIAQLDYSLGSAYEQLATLLPEVTGSPLEAFFDCDQINVTEVSDLPSNLTNRDAPEKAILLAGTSVYELDTWMCNDVYVCIRFAYLIYIHCMALRCIALQNRTEQNIPIYILVLYLPPYLSACLPIYLPTYTDRQTGRQACIHACSHM